MHVLFVHPNFPAQFRCVAPRFEESSVSPDGLTPRELAETLAMGKAESVSSEEPGATVCVLEAGPPDRTG